MTRRWGTLLLLLLLLIAGCTRDAGVESFDPNGTGGQADTTQNETPTTTGADAQSDPLNQTDADADTDADATEDEPGIAITVATETDIPILDVTDTPTDVPNTPTAIASPTDLPPGGDATSTPAAGFTPGGPSVPDEVQPVSTATPTLTATPFDGLNTDTDTDTSTDTDADTDTDTTVGDLGGNGSSEDGCTYTVQSGDNPFRIAVNNNITLDELRAANPNLGGSAVIQPGDVLEIPGCGQGSAVEDTPPDETTTEDNATPVPGDLIEYTVVSGDTLGRIANRYGVTITEIAEANELTNIDRLSVGQMLLIPQSDE